MFAGDRHFIAYVRLLPATFWHALRFVGTKRQLFSWHTIAGAFFALNGTIYAIGLAFGGGWKRIVPKGKQWAHDAMRPLAYSIPQRASYSAVIIGAIAMALTGAALWLRIRIPWLLPLHVLIATTLVLFAVVHVVQVLRAGPRTLRAMTVGTSESYTASKDSYTGQTL